MPTFPKLTPLQSRLAASLTASIVLLLLYLLFSTPQFAYAAEVDSIQPEDHNHERLAGTPIIDTGTTELELREVDGYQAEFFGYDRGIIGRTPTANEPLQLLNNVPNSANVIQGGLNSYSFMSSSIFNTTSNNRARSVFVDNSDDDFESKRILGGEGSLYLESRQASGQSKLVYISVNTCLQPQPIQNTTTDAAPQLQLYISQSPNNTNPGPNGDASTQQMVTLDAGFAAITINATGDIFMGLYGQNTTAYKDVWNAQLAASVDAYYHTYHNDSDSDGPDPNLFLVDSDSGSALLITGNLTNANQSSPVYQAWLNTPPPFLIFVSPENDPGIRGVQKSYCGMQQRAAIAPTTSGQNSARVDTSLTIRGNGQPRQQFYMNGFQTGTTYTAVLGAYGNSTSSGTNVVAGGGQIWPMTSFTTLSDGNCGVIFDLGFCNQTAYAVPGNPTTFPNATALAAFYDNATQAQYQYFQNVLAQVPCETTSSAQYSLARNCDDCAAAYKEWLCSVMIPRCTDFSSDKPWLQPRNMVQPFPNGTMLDSATVNFANQTLYLSSSRNPNIDSTVMPGPYKEVLPCEDLCYSIVQSCPSSMQFNCPQPGWIAFNQSYGRMPNGSPEQTGQITCNYPGAAYFLTSGGTRIATPWILLAVMISMFVI